jgi:clan AA aspartic protease
MGLTFIDGKVSHNKASASLRLLVDSGATYTVLPEAVWKKLKLTPKREQSFILADGTVMKRNVSECLIEIPQGSCHTPVILGHKNDEALLGAVTLEELAIVLNPFERKLQPMQARLG